MDQISALPQILRLTFMYVCIKPFLNLVNKNNTERVILPRVLLHASRVKTKKIKKLLRILFLTFFSEKSFLRVP